MKKIIIIEDQKEYREEWTNLFAEYGQYLDVEVEIPDEILDLQKLVARGIIEDAYFILDNSLAGFNSHISGSNIRLSLERLGVCNRTLMSSEDHLNSNVGKPSQDKALYLLCGIASLLCGVNVLDSDGGVHLLVWSEKEFHTFDVPPDTPEDMQKEVKAVNLVMRAWFKKKAER
jgi:hypothetical protein